MQLKLLQKEQFKEQQLVQLVATDDLFGNKIVDKITQQFCESQNLHKRIIQKKIKNKFLEKDIHLQNKDRKLLMV